MKIKGFKHRIETPYGIDATYFEITEYRVTKVNYDQSPTHKDVGIKIEGWVNEQARYEDEKGMTINPIFTDYINWNNIGGKTIEFDFKEDVEQQAYQKLSELPQWSWLDFIYY